MTNTKTTVLAALIATSAGLAIGSGAYAQDPQPPMMDPTMMAMLEGPYLALEHRARLGLSTEQVQRLEMARARLHEQHHPLTQQMRAVHMELAEVMAHDLDETRARAALARMGEIHAEAGILMLRARQETRAVLTPRQREQLAGIAHARMAEAMRHHHGIGSGMPGPGFMHCPMIPQDGHGPAAPRHQHQHRH